LQHYTGFLQIEILISFDYYEGTGMNKLTESIFGFLNPKENTLKRFQVFSRFPFFEKKRKPRNDVLAKENARLELGICAIQNESIQHQCSFDVQALLNWQIPPLGGLGIAFFRPSPLFLPQDGVMPLYSIDCSDVPRHHRQSP
jgi:hypothetical protein